MKPFKLPKKQTSQVKHKLNIRDKIVGSFVNQVEQYLHSVTDKIIDHYLKTGQISIPQMNDLYVITDNYYRDVISSAYNLAKKQKLKGNEKTKLSFIKDRLPKSLKDLENVFRDKRKFPRIMKRSKRVTDDLRKSYLDKLAKKFKIISPALKSGEISPKEAKKQMMDTWKTTKARVETIFRTETTNYFEDAQVSFYSDEDDVIGFLFDSVRDNSRTSICKSRHGLVYRPGTKLLSDNTPGCHWNCRSHLIALANTPENRKMLEDPNRDPSKVAVVPLPKGWKK
jgi:SPP1 gp7 family putative phage head morphogenesis protein